MVIFATVIAAIVAFGAIADFYYRGRNVRACHDLWIATLVIVTCTPFLPYLSRQIAMPIHAPMIPTRVWSDSCDFRLTRSGHADEGQLVSDGRVKQRISTKNAVDAGGATDEESPPTVHPQATERLIDAASGSPTRVERATSVNDVVEMPLGARDWGKGLLATWVVGAAFQIIRTLLGLVRLRQTCRRAIPGDHFLTDEIWKEVSSAVQSGRKPALRICEAEAGPFVTGFFRPAIYVPKHLAKDT